MPHRTVVALIIFGFTILSKPVSAVELFGKGSVSENALAVDKSTISVSITGGFAFALMPSVRIEARYTNISSLQNKLDVVGASAVGTLTNIMTQTAIYSVGVDIDLLGEKSAFQPFIFLGSGYIQTDRSYYFTAAGASQASYYADPTQTGISANGGLGIRLRIGRSFALEIEAYGYALDVTTPTPLLNLFGTAGIRIFI